MTKRPKQPDDGTTGRPGALGECTLFETWTPDVVPFEGSYCKHCGGVLQKHKTVPLCPPQQLNKEP